LEIYTEDFLANLDSLELVVKIKQFRSLDFRVLSEDEIDERIQNVLIHNGRYSFYSNHCTINKGYMYRVRKIEDSHLLQVNNYVESDFWDPPAEYAKQGRLNRKGESLLYTAISRPLTAVQEAKIQKGEHFLLIVYEVVKDIEAIEIGGNFDSQYSGILNHCSKDKIILNNEIVNSFLIDEFRRDVGEGTEYLYKLSRTIAGCFGFPNAGTGFDGIKYPAAFDASEWNVCLLPQKARESLRLKNAFIAEHHYECDKLTLTQVMTGYSRVERAKFRNLSWHEQAMFSDKWWSDF